MLPHLSDNGAQAGSAFCVPASGSVALTVTWTPTPATKSFQVRELMVLGNGKHKFHVKLLAAFRIPTPKKVYKASVVPKSNKVGFKPVFRVKPATETRRLSSDGGGGDDNVADAKTFLTRRSRSLKVTLHSISLCVLVRLFYKLHYCRKNVQMYTHSFTILR